MHIHILGICGTFMGGLAVIARSAGLTVTGCDAGVYPPMSTQLEEQGITLIEGFDAEQVSLQPDLFVVGNVVSRGNPLMEEILRQGLPYISGPQWLGEHILQGQHVIAVAGTHGKTTTSSMLAWILEYAGLKPNFLIGGIAPDLGLSARYDPAQKLFVIEADEYDTAFFDKRSKFVHYRPRTAILNNLEFDHADIFTDLAAIQTQFHHLVRTIPDTGRIIKPSDDPNIDSALAQGCWTPTVSVGPDGDWQAVESEAGTLQVMHARKTVATIAWNLSGTHNTHNALAALAAADVFGVSAAVACDALSNFKGIKRRMELRGEAAGVKVYDDFAHHPTAIALTLEGVRKRIGSKRILAVLEPRSNTMKLGAMAKRLPEALSEADLCFCFGEQEGKHALGWDAAEVLAPMGDRATAWHDLDAMVSAIVAQAQQGDHIIVMSNGSFGGVHLKLLDALATTATL
ncbi:UDP-N-acetylmuramate:L-alanyl-gamma-D-glutamyl-meso-diaminopimelate ligase [Paenalcaligenes niemegkensis]|uniref:UDP-N-acetylmuramate:L-alanyl-gamma-D-glutamyl- meso-diaminopimelate ligase n=1 Tax=Paenalcaligenes niemegkensis TaxID=2895469 RepID=UPI001EE78A9F|nr:UDP-N-acetylmuramate:L-alanyl-gamma-D-glutamyl-meso-diaminopimelate ligase [Paenalcaligenes niemegkensis]MCQ9615464.1 UDP-N-acetylmuramate:L-alanyl-gamma-D-glutamyl-meso-diaminopimelate ligase [Paenalcaligenes niemegkensis]